MRKRLYIGNIPSDSSQEDIASLFAPFGQVESIDLIIDQETGRLKGFGFVEMTSPEEAASAMQALNGREFRGKILIVNMAKPHHKHRPHRHPKPR